MTATGDFAPVSSKEFLDIQAAIECGLTLKRVRDMMRTYSQYLSTPWFSANTRKCGAKIIIIIKKLSQSGSH